MASEDPTCACASGDVAIIVLCGETVRPQFES